jgi:hypothetical protein
MNIYEMRFVHTSHAVLMVVYFASNFAKNGGSIRLQNYLAMPHVFQIFHTHPSTQTSFQQYGRFIKEVTSGKSIQTQMQIVNGKGILEDHQLDLKQYPISFTKEEVRHAETN